MPETRDVNGYSSATPASDGDNVYVLFGTGVAACYDMEGNRKWIKMLEKSKHQWGHSASPLVVGDKLIVHINDIFALDKKTGISSGEAYQGRDGVQRSTPESAMWML